MIAALSLMLQAASPPPMPPPDWSALPVLRYAHPLNPDVDLSAFVRAEVRAGRCARVVLGPAGGATLTIELAVLATPQSTVRRIVPRAIDCPSVEQYAAGIVSSLARGNVDAQGADRDAWYRTSMVFSWRQ